MAKDVDRFRNAPTIHFLSSQLLLQVHKLHGLLNTLHETHTGLETDVVC